MFSTLRTDILSRYTVDFPRIHARELVGARKVTDACGYVVLFSYPKPKAKPIKWTIQDEINLGIAESEGF